MSVLVKANSTRAQAFKIGFWKGLGAPVVLFGNFDLEYGNAEHFQPKSLPTRKRGSISEDWKAVGKQIAGATKLG
jgi:hypothetical protein